MSDISEDVVMISRAEYAELLAYRAADPGRRPREVQELIAGGATALRAWRRFRGLTQAQLAARAGIGQGYLSDLETGGGKEPSRMTLHFLARALGVPAAAL